MLLTKVGRRGQITLPRAIRKSLGLQEGDRIAFLHRGGEVILWPVKETLLDLRGSVRVEGPQDFDQIRTEVKRHLAQQGLKDGK